MQEKVVHRKDGVSHPVGAALLHTEESLRSNKPGLTLLPVTESPCTDLPVLNRKNMVLALCSWLSSQDAGRGLICITPSFSLGEECAFKTPHDYHSLVPVTELSAWADWVAFRWNQMGRGTPEVHLMSSKHRWLCGHRTRLDGSEVKPLALHTHTFCGCLGPQHQLYRSAHPLRLLRRMGWCVDIACVILKEVREAARTGHNDDDRKCWHPPPN